MYLSLNAVPIGGHLSWPEFARLASKTGFLGVDAMLEPAMAEDLRGRGGFWRICGLSRHS